MYKLRTKIFPFISIFLIIGCQEPENAFIEKVLILEELESYDQALVELKNLFKEYPGNRRGQFLKGRIKRKMGNNREAMNILSSLQNSIVIGEIAKGVSLSIDGYAYEPKYTFDMNSLSYELGLAYYLNNIFPFAIEEFEFCIENEYTAKGECYYYKGLSLLKLGKNHKGCESLDQAIELGFESARDSFNNYCSKKSK